jgi:hypothetical protein
MLLQIPQSLFVSRHWDVITGLNAGHWTCNTSVPEFVSRLRDCVIGKSVILWQSASARVH